jgi:hypothetical protein
MSNSETIIKLLVERDELRASIDRILPFSPPPDGDERFGGVYFQALVDGDVIRHFSVAATDGSRCARAEVKGVSVVDCSVDFDALPNNSRVEWFVPHSMLASANFWAAAKSTRVELGLRRHGGRDVRGDQWEETIAVAAGCRIRQELTTLGEWRHVAPAFDEVEAKNRSYHRFGRRALLAALKTRCETVRLFGVSSTLAVTLDVESLLPVADWSPQGTQKEKDRPGTWQAPTSVARLSGPDESLTPGGWVAANRRLLLDALKAPSSFFSWAGDPEKVKVSGEVEIAFGPHVLDGIQLRDVGGPRDFFSIVMPMRF